MSDSVIYLYISMAVIQPKARGCRQLHSHPNQLLKLHSMTLFVRNAANGVIQTVKWLEFCYHLNITLLEKTLSQSGSRTRNNYFINNCKI